MPRHTKHDFDSSDSFDARDEQFEVKTRQIRRKARREDDPAPTRSGRLTLEARDLLALARAEAVVDDLPDGTDRWSTWGDGDLGPHPRPDWVVTHLGAADTELGVLKTGKEADVHVIRRAVPGTDGCLLAAKRYRSGEHRLFHRDAGYLEGRRMRRSREMRAMANRTAFGRNLIAEQWAVAEFAALSRLWSVGAPVPYPVQRNGTELLLEYLCDDTGTAAPRLAERRPDLDELTDLWQQLVAALDLMATHGLTHGDLSAYNLLVHDGHLMLIDLPQVVDVVANPGGVDFLARDVANIAAWFRGRGLTDEMVNPDALTAQLLHAAGLD